MSLWMIVNYYLSVSGKKPESALKKVARLSKLMENRLHDF